MGKPVVHWEINARNPSSLHKFYADLFGWKIDANNPINYGMVETGSPGINGGIGPADGEGYITFYVQVEDLQAYLEKAERLGGKVVVPPTEVPGMVTYAMFTDPEGFRIGLVKG